MSEALVEVEIFDTTLRDGAQSLPEANQFPMGSKVHLADQIAGLGVGVIEAGFPRTGSDGEEVQEVAKSVGNTTYEVARWRNGEQQGVENTMPVIAGLSRTTREDIDAAWDSTRVAARPRIHTFVSTDAEHMAAKFSGKSPDQVLEMGRQAVRHAKAITAEHQGATVEFSAEAASTTEPAYLEQVVKMAIDEGADVINLPDTVGQRDPFWMERFYGRVFNWVNRTNPNVVVSAHNHNDLDMATMNSLSLVIAAAKQAQREQRTVGVQIESAICGLGERAGNADVFPVVAGLFKFTDQFESDVDWSFNPDRSVHVAQFVMAFADFSVNRQNPVVGEDINVHRSGIHSDGIVKGGHRIYTPYSPTFWGHASDAQHEEGKYQGTKGRQAIDKA